MFRHWNNGTLKGAGYPNLLMNLHQAQRRLIQVMLVCQNQNRSNRSNDLDPVGVAGIQPEAAKKTNTFFWHHVCETYILYQFWQYLFKHAMRYSLCHQPFSTLSHSSNFRNSWLKSAQYPWFFCPSSFVDPVAKGAGQERTPAICCWPNQYPPSCGEKAPTWP